MPGNAGSTTVTVCPVCGLDAHEGIAGTKNGTHSDGFHVGVARASLKMALDELGRDRRALALENLDRVRRCLDAL